MSTNLISSSSPLSEFDPLHPTRKIEILVDRSSLDELNYMCSTELLRSYYIDVYYYLLIRIGLLLLKVVLLLYYSIVNIVLYNIDTDIYYSLYFQINIVEIIYFMITLITTYQYKSLYKQCISYPKHILEFTPLNIVMKIQIILYELLTVFTFYSSIIYWIFTFDRSNYFIIDIIFCGIPIFIVEIMFSRLILFSSHSHIVLLFILYFLGIYHPIYHSITQKWLFNLSPLIPINWAIYIALIAGAYTLYFIFLYILDQKSKYSKRKTLCSIPLYGYGTLRTHALIK